MKDFRTLSGLQHALDQSPFQQTLGLKAHVLGLDWPRIELLLSYRPLLARQSGGEQVHGGVIASLIDIAGDCVLAVQLGYFVPSINLHTDYLGPAFATLRATAEIVRCGRTIGVADIDVFDPKDRLVGTAGGLMRPGRGSGPVAIVLRDCIGSGELPLEHERATAISG